MGWSMTDKRNLRHINGALITLVSGTWRQPEEIHPRMPECLSALQQAELIRQGLGYARHIELKLQAQ